MKQFKTWSGLLAVIMLVLLAPMAAVSAQPDGRSAHKRTPVHGHRKHAHEVQHATFGASPGTAVGADGRSDFFFDTTPGGHATDHIVITNYSDANETLQVYPVDAVTATNGTISFPSPTAKRTGAGAWMAIGTPHSRGTVRIRARHAIVLPIHVLVPGDAPPGDHVGAIVVSLTAAVKGGGFGSGGHSHLKFLQRIAVQAVFRVSGPQHPNLSIEGLKASYSGPIDPFAKGTVQVTYVVHNGGNVVLGGPQSVTIHGLFGESLAGPTQAIVPALLPGASYPVTVRVPAVFPEVLMTAKVSVDEQGLKGDVDTGLITLTASVHFLAIPWVILAIIVLLLSWVWFTIWRRRRRKAQGAHGAFSPGRGQTEPPPEGAKV